MSLRPKVYYLVGSIEHHPTNGWHWRNSLQTFLEAKGHKVINPVTAEIKALQVADTPLDWQKFKKTNLTKYCIIMRQIIDFDLDVVINQCDAIIVRWDEYIPKGAGSHAEISFAYYFKKPVFLIYEGDISEIPGWLLGCVSKFYTSIKSFKEGFDVLVSDSMASRPKGGD